MWRRRRVAFAPADMVAMHTILECPDCPGLTVQRGYYTDWRCEHCGGLHAKMVLVIR